MGWSKNVVAIVTLEQWLPFIPQMIAHAWKGYVAYAFGENELKPISRRGHSAVVFGQTRVGATVVDSLGTLYIAGLMEEYKKGRDWVAQSLNFDQVSVGCISPFPSPHSS